MHELPSRSSASEQVAQASDISTMLEPPKPVLRMVELEHVRSKINELDQRKLRQQQYSLVLEQLIKPFTKALEPKLPFKLPNMAFSARQSLRTCSSAEEILQLTSNPQQLADELIKLSSELNTEKRKHNVVVENYLELKQEMQNVKSKAN
ncbi:hypothetical protein KR222_006862 [Zaprionus bogoriensis]|nr:hypothetical protein KR222_006862 [Zaprionus bogoriensis]